MEPQKTEKKETLDDFLALSEKTSDKLGNFDYNDLPKLVYAAALYEILAQSAQKYSVKAAEVYRKASTGLQTAIGQYLKTLSAKYGEQLGKYAPKQAQPKPAYAGSGKKY
jgi:hypothetical protein